jgi:hypothetical protein
VDKETVLKIISDFAKALEAEKTKPQKILLFGSCSTRTQVAEGYCAGSYLTMTSPPAGNSMVGLPSR